MAEPNSWWWQEIRVLLKYKRMTRPALYEWAEKLSEMSRETHRVPAKTIRDWMDSWKWDLTVEDILNFEPEPEESEEEIDPQSEAEPIAMEVPEVPVVEPAEEPLQESPILKPG